MESWKLEEKLLTASMLPSSLRRSAFFLSLTIGLSGLQAVFALIFSNGSAYLSSLGISEPALPLVWSVGPLCGLILQPCFGVWSDCCRSSWGKRKPFAFFGALGSIGSIICLASAKTLANGMSVLVFWFSRTNIEQKSISVVLALSSLIALNIAVQSIQCSLRTLIIDSVAPDQQQTANAWAGMLISLTNLLCYALSSIDLPRTLSFLGASQFSILCALTSLVLAATILVTCVTVNESSNMVLGSEAFGIRRHNVAAMLFDLYSSFFRLPPLIQTVLKVQFFSWIGWFPFLYYISSYLGKFESDTSESMLKAPHADPHFVATKPGSFGLLIFSSISLVSGITIPRIVARRTAKPHQDVLGKSAGPQALRQTWAVSQILFALCMLSTIFITTLSQAYVLVGLSGISWGVTIWAPHALIGANVLESAGRQLDDDLLDDVDCELRTGVGTGIVVSLHNAAISAPQIVAALCCSVLFWVLDGISEDTIGWALRIAAFSTLTATWMMKRLHD